MVPNYVLKRGWGKTCSRRCSAILQHKTKDQSGEKNPNWKGGVSKDNYHYKKIQKERYPERVKARQIVADAIRAGKLKREPCEKCGGTIVHAHHDDYEKPLDVKWLCRKHHRDEHGGKH